MKHTKNILKSLLITVMALSLLAVSCKKDEGGTKNPVNPTPITITAENITKGFTALGATKSLGGVVFDFSKFTASKNAIELTAASGKASDNNALTTALGNLGITIAGTTVKSEVTGNVNIASQDNITVRVTITPSGNNTLDAKVKESYTVNNNAVEVTLTLKANSKNWNTEQKG